MFFASYNGRQKLGILIGIFVLILILSLFVGYKLNDYKNGEMKHAEGTQTEVEVKVLRTQNEIAMSYAQDMARILKRLNEIDNRAELELMAENSLLGFYVPTDMRDLHIKKAIEASKLLEDNNLSIEEFKTKLIVMINELDAENNRLIELLNN